MTERKRRDFDALSEAQVAAGLTAARRVSAGALATRDVGQLLDAIHHVAEAATGERSFLHLDPASRVAARPRPAS